MKFYVITNFITYASITSSIRLPPSDKATFSRLKRLRVVSYYKDPVLRKLRGQTLYKERQQPPLGFGKPPQPAYSFKSKKIACADAVSLGQSQTHILPPKTLADDYEQFNKLLKAVLRDLNNQRRAQNLRLTRDVTTFELVEFLKKPNLPAEFKAIRTSHKDFELCMLSKD